MLSVRKVLVFSFLDRYAGLIISTVSSMILARLLTPAEIGIYSVVMVLMGFLSNFRDLGAGQYLVRHQSLSPSIMRATFTVQICLGVFLALLMVLSAVPLAEFYREERIRNIIFVLALNVLITPLLSYPSAWLVRQMRFDLMAVVRFAGGLAHALFGIGLVLGNVGPISLAWANVASTLVGIICLQLVARPNLPRKPIRDGLREVISFGGRLTVVSLIDSVRVGTLEMIVGRIQGLAIAGHLSRAQGLVSMFEHLVLSAVNQVAMPYFAHENREGRPIGPLFVRAMAMVTGLGWPFFACLSLLAHPVIRLLYGPQWDVAVDPARWLALAAALALPGLICQSPLIAKNAISDLLKASSFSMIITVAAGLLGATHSLLFATQLMAVTSLISSVFWLSRTLPLISAPVSDVWRVLVKSLLLAVAAMVPVGVVVAVYGLEPAFQVAPISLSIIGGALSFLAALRLTRHELWVEVAKITALPWVRRWFSR